MVESILANAGELIGAVSLAAAAIAALLHRKRTNEDAILTKAILAGAIIERTDDGGYDLGCGWKLVVGEEVMFSNSRVGLARAYLEMVGVKV